MLHLKKYCDNADHPALNFLEHSSSISQLLSAEPTPDPEKVATIIEPILKAPERCSVTSLYIQAIAIDKTTVLATNLSSPQSVEVTAIGSSWLIGRSLNCAITVLDRSVSRCHAVIGCYESGQFYITDVGSSNGTSVNRRRLKPLERYILCDGDLIGIGSLNVEFFVSHSSQNLFDVSEMQSQATKF